MAIYYLDVKPIGGKSCRSAVGAAAYRTGEKLYNERDGITHDYTKRRGPVGAAAYRSGEKLHDGKTAHDFTKKGDIIYSEIMLPKHAREEFRDSSTLWNSAEKAERNCNARTGREIVVALPNELTPEQQIKLVQDYVKRNFVDEGMCAGFSIHSGHIHEKKGEVYPFEDLTVRKDNPHAHIQLTVRPLNKDGTWGEKSKKQYILDKNGNRIKLPSGNWKIRKIELTDWDKTETLLKWRENWAVTVNKEFERLGIDERISHLSLKEQGISREPTKHMGHEAWNLEKKGIKTRIGDENREIIARNKAISPEISPEITAEYMHELKQGYCILDKEIATTNQKANEAQREMQSLRFKVDNIKEDSEHIHTMRAKLDELKKQRQEMGYFTSKKDIDEQIAYLENSREQAENHFEKSYYITPEQLPEGIKRIGYETSDWERIHKNLQDKKTQLEVDKKVFELEYKRQKVLTAINPDGQRTKDRLAQLDKETLLSEKSAQDRNTQIKCEQKLDTITKEDLLEIRKDLKYEQAKAYINVLRKHKQAQESKKAQEHEKTREHIRAR